MEFEASEMMKFQIQSKIKRIKVIRQVYIMDCTKAESGVVLGILKSKNKQIKTFEGVKSQILQNFPSLQSFTLKMQDLASWKVFLRSLHLESLEIESSELLNFQMEKATSPIIINYLKSRFWTHLAKIPAINKLQLHLNNSIDDVLLNFLQRFSTLQMRLLSAKTLTCTFNYVENLAQYNPDFSKIFPHVAVIKTLELSYQSLQKLMTSLPYCSKMKKLSVLKAMSNNNEGLISFSYLNNLMGLENLQTLQLSINLKSSEATLSFFENFCLPPVITNIALDLHEIDWKALVPTICPKKTRSSDIFQANKICAQFYEKWKNLRNLTAFNFSLIEEEGSHPSFGFSFVLPILQNIETLTSFYYSNSCEPLSDEQDYTDFHHFWLSLRHLSSTLKTLYLETCEISLKNFSLVNGSETGALTKLGLCGNVYGDVRLQNLYNLFSKTNLKSDKLQLEIGCLMIKDLRCFDEFLEGVTHCPRQIKLAMDIDVQTVATEDFISTIQEYISRIHGRSLNKINFMNLKSLQPTDIKELKQILFEYKLSEHIQISDQRGKGLQRPNGLDLLNYDDENSENDDDDDEDEDDSFFSAAEEEDDNNEISNDEDDCMN